MAFRSHKNTAQGPSRGLQEQFVYIAETDHTFSHAPVISLCETLRSSARLATLLPPPQHRPKRGRDVLTLLLSSEGHELLADLLLPQLLTHPESLGCLRMACRRLCAFVAAQGALWGRLCSGLKLTTVARSALAGLSPHLRYARSRNASFEARYLLLEARREGVRPRRRGTHTDFPTFFHVAELRAGPSHRSTREWYDRVLAAVEAGADVTTSDRDAQNLLHLAATFGDDATARLLVAAGADVFARDRFGRDSFSKAGGRQALQDGSAVAAFLHRATLAASLPRGPEDQLAG